jgi:hypothetical protein
MHEETHLLDIVEDVGTSECEALKGTRDAKLEKRRKKRGTHHGGKKSGIACCQNYIIHTRKQISQYEPI